MLGWREMAKGCLVELLVGEWKGKRGTPGKREGMVVLEEGVEMLMVGEEAL